MMEGIVNAQLEATLPLTVFGPNGEQRDITAVIDTGYNGVLSLPLQVALDLNLAPAASRMVMLGDRSQKLLTFYKADVLWNGQKRHVSILCVEGEPLIGTALLKGFRLNIDFEVGGLVRVVSP